MMNLVVLLGGVVGVLVFIGARLGRVKMPERYWLVAPPILVVAVGGVAVSGKRFVQFGDMSRQRAITRQLDEARAKFPSCFRADGPCELSTLELRKSGCMARNGRRFDDWRLGCDLTPELISMTRSGGLLFSLCVHEEGSGELLVVGASREQNKTCARSYFWLATEDVVVRVDPSNTPTPAGD
ncbi:MAG: hypothetical protein ACO1OB_17990 [Archangium sp.]